MRPLLRHVSGPVVESIFTLTTPSVKLVAPKTWLSHNLRPATCIQCRLRARSRPYSDSNKPPPYTTAKGNGTVPSSPSPSLENKAESTSSLPPPPNLSSISNDGTAHTQRRELPSQEEQRRSHIAKRFSHVMDNMQSNIFIAGKRLNDLTGYSGIEVMKKEIEEQEELVRNTRASLRAAKDAYSAAITQRSASQREVNELLQRKHAWTPPDLERFTSLYRSDHANEQAESAAQEALTLSERRAEEAAAKLSKSILARYHEEQIWSDKIRRMSTWGTWGLMGVNVLLFLVFQIGVEPWRRKRLVKGFEEKVMEALERDGAGATNHRDGGSASLLAAPTSNQAIAEAEEAPIEAPPATPLENHPEVLAAVEEVTACATQSRDPPLDPSHALGSPPSKFEAYKEALRDLFSEREIVIRQRHLTNVALEGVAAGVALVGFLVVFLRPR
ncbi:MAG: sensitivity to high expression protein she9 [Pleopsidium flavum]|nr:MAG: sensitivity to high expression protein she9 [Pleopsidium flavum]